MERLDRLENLDIAVLTDPGGWFESYARELADKLEADGHRVTVSSRVEDISGHRDIAFILGYYRLVPPRFLEQNTHNIVVHESRLPEGRGWSPVTWQVLEGMDRIPVTMFEAREEVDSGEVYIRDEIVLDGYELVDEIRQKQGQKKMEMALRFVREYGAISAEAQTGDGSYYKKRAPADSELDPDRTIREQFNLLRIVDNEQYPAFFVIGGQRYKLKVYKDDRK